MAKVNTYVTDDRIPSGPTTNDRFAEWSEALIAAEGRSNEDVLDTLGTFLARFRTYCKVQGFTWAQVEAQARIALARQRADKLETAEPHLPEIT